MSGHVFWHTAQMGWTPRGHVLHIGHMLEERAALRWQEVLERWFDERSDGGVTVTVKPMQREQDERGARTHQGSLSITSLALLTMDADVVRDTIERVADEAEQWLAEIIRQETSLMLEFLQKIKGIPGPEGT